MSLARRFLTGALPAVLLSLALALVPLQGGQHAGTGLPPGAAVAQTATAVPGVDLAAWEREARRAEQMLAHGRASNMSLEQLRARIAEFRAGLLQAQTANQSRIETLRGQLRALGTPPEDGGTDTPEIAQRRAELNEQLARLQAPVVAAEEAFRRADGLIREIDRTLRERQADALLQLSPMPINPANWPVAVRELQALYTALQREVTVAWANPVRRAELNDNLLLVMAYLLLAVALLWRGRRWMALFLDRIAAMAPAKGRPVWALLLSLGQVLLPYFGVLLLTWALLATGLVGLRGEALVTAFPVIGLTVLLAIWLGARLFPGTEGPDDFFRLPPERQREGRFHAAMLGLLLGVEGFRDALMAPVVVVPAAESVLAWPVLLVSGLFLFRVGQLLAQHARAAEPGGATPGGASDANPDRDFHTRLIAMVGRIAMAIGVLAPVVSAVGYVAAAQAVLYPMILTLALIGALMILQRLVAEVYALAMGGDPTQREALVPVLAGFALVVGALPLFALVWGLRPAELIEIFERMREGFTLGDTRISPNDFIAFLVVFGIGYAVTRMLQGALRGSVLPKTRLDKGGQNAVVSGLGYLGIFLAALIAFSSAGIDLSNLAIVAGALSVGIGFGLQQIVSNFVSGVILLFERPVAEGDWIEVGGVMGTVRKISVRSTTITTFDRTDVIVPNADLVSGQVTNWTRYNLTGRLIVPVGVAYGSDTRKVERILFEVAEAQPLVVLNPPPGVLFRGFGDSALNFEIRVILRDVNFMLSVHSDMNHEIARRLAEEGIEIPFPQRDLWLRNPEALTSPRADGVGGPSTVQAGPGGQNQPSAPPGEAGGALAIASRSPHDPRAANA